MIAKCGCDNTGQDKLYGKQKRVFNKTSKEKHYRCSVCTKEKDIK